ncbi:GntR family transcriptional regulator [Georgenia sp. Z1344]|uniref:GntR family transcriptional regulator n=1 Tax=Georgenia sp. Z1344 TaxID=3416706 RepID=UPI003CF8E7AA
MTSDSSATRRKTTPSKSERVYSELYRRIVDGTYTPGYRLVLSQVAESFGTSALPVREAVRRLEAEGLVTYRRNIGAEVAGIDPVGYADVMQSMALLEGYATALAAEHLTEQDIATARDINEQLRRMRGEDFDPVSFTRLNQEFHTVLCGPCPNAHLTEMLAREQERMGAIRRSSFSYVPGRARTSVEEHDEILALVSAATIDVDQLERVARDHKLHTLTQFLAKTASA